jgi:sporulation protein YlmC with PRC-barrel domain
MKLLSEVRDLQIVDKDGRNCGICDDIEFDGRPGEPLKIKALLVGPGAYKGRLPRWLYSAIKLIAGDHVARVPWKAIEHITARITLTDSGEKFGLLRVETKLQKFIKRVPFP